MARALASSTPRRIRRLAREPLVQFLLGGLLVFALFAWRGDDSETAERTITVSASEIAAMEAQFLRSWQRAPEEAELRALIEDFVKSEIYAREARRAGLDRDDPVVRRRLRSRMEYLARSEAENAVPDDAALERFYRKNAARYAPGARFSFDQLYLDPQRDTAAAAAVLHRLRSGARWSGLGDTIALPASLDDAQSQEITRHFGTAFAEQIATLEPGDWTGPLKSGLGQHLVRLRQVEAGSVPPLAAIRARVEADWRAETAKRREAQAYATLADRYRIAIARE